MKKLMFAAVAMASAAAMAGICDNICVPEADPVLRCRAYDFKASLKLVDGKTADSKSAKTICVGSITSTAYYRIAATRKVKGVFTDCDVCNQTNSNVTASGYNNKAGGEALLLGVDGAAALTGDYAHFYVATSDMKYKVVATTEDTDTTGTAAPSAWYGFKLLNFFGGTTADKAKKVEGLLAINFTEADKFGEFRKYSLLCAGFGAQANGLIKNISGNLAGAVDAATWCGIPTVVFEPCKLDPSSYDYQFNPDGSFNTVKYDVADAGCTTWLSFVENLPSYSLDAVSGTWSLKYNASESKLNSANALFKKVFGSDITSVATFYKQVTSNEWADPTATGYPLLFTKNY